MCHGTTSASRRWPIGFYLARPASNVEHGYQVRVVDKYEAHFIGGPRDGQTMSLNAAGDFFQVAVMPSDSCVMRECFPPYSEVQTFEKFTYRLLNIQRGVQVYVPSDWWSTHQGDLKAYVVSRLLRGYVGNRS